MSEYRFHGRERVTIELAGTCDARAIALPPGLAHDGGRVGLFAFAVERLRIAGLPLLAWSYPELLWRIAVRRDGEPAWWVVACDLPAWGPRVAARRYVRYEVRPHAVEVTETRLASTGDAGTLALALGAEAGPGTVERRGILVGRDPLYRVPWGDDDTPAVRVAARVESDSLALPTLGGSVTWAQTATLRRGRQHRCGVARR